MTPPADEFPWKLQGAVYGSAFFNGPVQSMAAMVAALLVGGMVSTDAPLLIALILASRQMLLVAMSISGGAMIDRLGGRQVIFTFGLIGAATAALFPVLPEVYGFAPVGGAMMPSLLLVVLLIGLQMVSGYAEGTCWIANQTLVAQLLKGRPLYAGRMTFIARVGGIVGPGATGAAWDLFGPWGGFGFLAAWIAAGGSAALFLPRTAPNGGAGPATGEGSAAAADPGAGASAEMSPARAASHAADYWATLKLLVVPGVALVVLCTVMRQTGSGIQSSFYVVWLDKEIGLSGAVIGSLVSISNVASSIAAISTGRLASRIAAHWLLIVTIAMSVVGVAVTPLMGDVYVLLVLAICVRGAGQGLNLPMMMTILADSVAPHLQGRVTAMRISFNRFGGAMVPLIMGALAEIVGIANSFYVVGGVGVLALAGLSLWVARAPAFRANAAATS